MRIAYVEDNPTNLALVERVASMNQHVIVSYTEGEIALEELKKQTFDLILMDVELAGDMGGLEVVRRLRAHGLQTPIIAVTAYAMIGDRDRCIEAGCTDYLSKPMPIPQLIALLNRYDEITKQPPTLITKPVPPELVVPKVETPKPAETTAVPASAPVIPEKPVAENPVPEKPATPAESVVPAPKVEDVAVETVKPTQQDELTPTKPTS